MIRSHRRETITRTVERDWEPGDPVHANPPERLTCVRCGTQVSWGSDVPTVCPECDGQLADAPGPSLAVAYFGRFEGPDHLYPYCPALQRVKPWKQPWPAQTVDFVDPDGTNLCGWCTRVWRSRKGA